MNNNTKAVRSGPEKQSHKGSGIGTRHSSIATPNNNIHININLNVKKKSSCYHPDTMHGKKIQNYFELSHVKPQPINTNQIKQNPKAIQPKHNFLLNKPETLKQQQKTKKKKTKEKQKTASKPFTPEKHFKPQSEEKSLEKSRTNKKLARKKQSKSMENIKVFKQKPLHLQQNKHRIHDSKTPVPQTKKNLNPTQNHKDKQKFRSSSNSTSKQRSRQKSAQKLKKMRSSSKTIISFTNSGIKKMITSQKQSGNKNEALQNMRKSKKSLKVNKIAQKDMIKINEFMEEKKKQDEKKKKQKEGDQNSKDIKIKDDIMKLSKKQFYTKPEKSSITQSISEYKRRSKFPMFYGEEQQNNEQDEQRTSQNFTKPIRHENRTPEKSRPYSKQTSPDHHKKSSAKKHPQCLVSKYINGDITKKQKKQLKHQVIVIQAFWRGYWLRKNLMQEITNMTRANSHKKKLIQQKKSEFWDDDENNSIINLENSENKGQKPQKSTPKKQKPSDSKNSYKTPEKSNYNSSETPTEQNHTNHKKYESQSGHQNEFMAGQSHEKRLNINEFRKNIEKLQHKQKAQAKSSVSKSQDVQNNSLLASQIELLKKKIEEQNKKFLQLEIENTELKQNLKSIVVEKQKDTTPKIDFRQEKQSFQIHSNSNTNSQPISPIDIDDDSVVIYELNRNHFAPVNSLQTSQDPKKQFSQKFRSLKIQTESQLSDKFSKPSYSSAQSPSNPYVQNLKRQFESFESPSNRELKQAELSNLKGLQKAFKKKELSINATYQKNAKLYQQMLQNNTVSPRTYSFKKVELEEKYKKQKEQISQKYQEAEKVIKYISEEIVEEQKVGQDESPKKSKTQEDEKIEGLKKEDFKQVSETIQVDVQEKGLTPQINRNEVKEQSEKNQMKQNLEKEIESYNGSLNPSQVPEEGQNNFRKYWTEDMEQVHKKVLQISNKIDEALQSDSKYSESLKSDSNKEFSSENKEYSSQNSNFQSLISSKSESVQLNGIDINQHLGDDMRSPIFQQTEYQIEQPSQKQIQQKSEQGDQVMANNSNVSSTSSGRNLDVYNIHYPSSPKNQTAKKLNFEVRHENYEQGENSVQGNNSQLSQNRSSLSESSVSRPKEMKGFDTRLTFIKEYCIALCEFIRSQDELKQKFVDNISTPLKYDYFEILKAYRTTYAGQNDTKYNSTIEDYLYPYFKVLKGSLIEKGLNADNTAKFQELYEQNYNVSKELTPQMLAIRKFFIQAIIDVFNESLDYQRPGSVYGEPLPWLVQSKNLRNNQVKFLAEPEPQRQLQTHESSDQLQEPEEDERLDKIFGVAIAKIIQWGSCLCGFIPEPVSFDGEDAQAVNIDDEQTNLVRETRLAYMLEKALADDEQKMVDNTMEQLEVQLELQQMLVYELVSEFAEEFQTICKK